MTAKKSANPVKKAPAKKPAAKKADKPVEKETHPFGTCVPLGECICNNRKDN